MLRRAETLTVKTAAGTELPPLRARARLGETSGLISPRYWFDLPHEKSSQRRQNRGRQGSVCDATAGYHFNGKYGDLQTTPRVLEK